MFLRTLSLIAFSCSLAAQGAEIYSNGPLVTDPTGAVIPGATVTLRNVDTGISRTLSSDAAGKYRAPQLGLGNYEITAESTGFQTEVRSGIGLAVGQEAVVNFSLQVGAVEQTVEVVHGDYRISNIEYRISNIER